MRGCGPGLIIGKVRGGAAREQTLHHLHGVHARSPAERRGRELVIARRDVGAGIEQDAGEFDVAALGIRSTADEVQQGLVLPVHEVRAHAMSQQRAKHVRVFQEIALAAGQHRWHADTRVEQPAQQVPFSFRDNRREHTAAD
jgi:hypothetical protein